LTKRNILNRFRSPIEASASYLVIFVTTVKYVVEKAVLRIRDVYPRSRIRLFSIPDHGSRIRTVSIPDPGSSSKNPSILTPKKTKKMVYKV
jgi:hypothetical protein